MQSRIAYYKDKFDLDRSHRFADPAGSFETLTDDGVRIRGSYLEGKDGKVFMVVHGLFAHHRAPGFAEAAESLRRFGDVVSIDLRGHGASEGRCTLGNLEALDVAAAVRWVRDRTSDPITLVGFSMGAAASVRAAGGPVKVEEVVSISGPARWRGQRRWAARRTALVWKTPGLPKMAERLIGVHLDPDWQASDEPAEVASAISPASFLVVHGSGDAFFTEEAAAELYERAGDPKQLWIVPGGGHAEGLFMEPARPVVQSRVDAFVDGMVERLRQLGEVDRPSRVH